jgi:hypothetical protein
MIPVMEENYRRPPSGRIDPAVAALLDHQGLVLERHHRHLDRAAIDLARLVKKAIAQRDRD